MIRRENNIISKTEMFINAVLFVRASFNCNKNKNVQVTDSKFGTVLAFFCSSLWFTLPKQSVKSFNIFYTELVQNIRECNNFLLNLYKNYVVVLNLK